MIMSRFIKFRNALKILVASVFATGVLPSEALLIPGLPPTAHLAWSPSPDPNIVGYNLYYGGQSGALSNHLVLGKETTASINASPGATMYFMIAARNQSGNISPLSEELSYTLPPAAHLANVAQGETIQPVYFSSLLVSNSAGGLIVGTAGPVGTVWILESSIDLASWQPVLSGTNSVVNLTVPITDAPCLFYRLRGP